MIAPDNPKLAYSIPEAATAISIGRSKLYELIAEGRVETRKIGKRTVIPGGVASPLAGGGVSNVAPYAKPRRAGRGFAQSTWWLVASLHYADRLADAIALFAIQPFASDGAGSVGALLWGAAR